MSRAHHTAAADLSSAGAPQYPRQQVVGNHPFDPLGVPVLQQAELLEKLEQTCLRLGRTPTREELVPALRIELTATFGSLRSALPQAGSTWIPSKTLEAEKDRPADLQHLTGCAGMACCTRNSSIPRPGVCRPPYALGDETG